VSRVINTNSPGKVRHHHQRTIAEILRHLSSKAEVDEQAKDMVSMLVFSLRGIRQSVDQSVTAWEKRGYWLKADRFLFEWEWASESAANLDDVIRNEAWDLLPGLLGELLPHSAGIEVKTFTRSPSTWQGAHEKLMAGPPGELPW
jgi:hypothetical protein